MDDKLLSRALRRLRRFFRLIFSFLDRVFKLSTPPPSSSSSQPRRRYHRTSKPLPARPTTLDGFAHDVELQLVGHLTTDKLADISRQIRAQLRTSAKNSPVSMLPSFNHTLPTGRERGTVLALDVGGSTLRVALVELSGSDAPIRIVRMTSYHIDEDVKLLEGRAFFDWMAQRIGEMLVGAGYDEKRDFGTSNVLPVGLSWSFPIDQTSIRSGRVISMGKGFLCSNGTVGEDLADLITEACQKRNLNVRIDAIINDSSATLLSRAYTDPTTRMSLILGTGTNVAVHFPVHAIGIEKFGDRPTDWFAQAKHVIVNTELSMFGGRGVLPRSRWDDELNRKHIKPDYQPLEYMATGRYLGEIVRLIIVEAVETAGLFGGELPPSMKHPYSFDTAISACIEEDDSPLLQTSSTVLQRHHSFTTPPTPIDLLFLQRVCKAVSRRAAAYLAAAIHGLWCLSNESESPLIPSTPKSNTIPEAGGTDGRASLRSSSNTQSPPLQVAIACDGSVINKYPNFREQCQGYLNQLTLEDGAFSPLLPVDFEDASFQSKEALASVRPSTLISLDPAQDSGILGAAVAVAIAVAPEG